MDGVKVIYNKNLKTLQDQEISLGSIEASTSDKNEHNISESKSIIVSWAAQQDQQENLTRNDD